MISYLILQDTIVLKIFQFFRTDFNVWKRKILTMNEWADQIDMLLFSYITKVNVISVGNYMNGMISNNMLLLLNQIMQCNNINISTNGSLPGYFHNIGSPLQKMMNGNHFGYLEPVDYPNISLSTNTIEPIITNDLTLNCSDTSVDLKNDYISDVNLNGLKGNNQFNTDNITNKSINVWSREENREIMKCYYLAQRQKLSKQSGTFKVWKERNPMVKPHVTSYQLIRQRLELENSMPISELQNIKNQAFYNH